MEIQITLTPSQRGDVWDRSGKNPAGDWRDVVTTRDEAELHALFDANEVPRTATVNIGSNHEGYHKSSPHKETMVQPLSRHRNLNIGEIINDNARRSRKND